jgi:hypothetical protein
MRLRRKILITVLILAVYVVHQDWWNWHRIFPLVFGILPAGLAYHVGYSILASVLMAVLVKLAWPKYLEDTQPPDSRPPEDDEEGHR